MHLDPEVDPQTCPGGSGMGSSWEKMKLKDEIKRQM